MNKSPILLIFALGALVMALLPALTLAAPPAQFGTQVTINNPSNGATLAPGTTYGIQSTSTAQDGIRFVQLFVDNVGINTISPNGFTTSFSVIQNWTATPGVHTITVSASSTNGNPGQSSIYVNVPNTPNPPQCVIGSNVVSQGNPPPNTQIQPGTSFQQSWQVQNTGTCSWAPSYAVSYVNGNSQLNSPSPTGIPNAYPNQTVTLSLNMRAPQQPGTYNSTWQLRAPNGVPFGQQMTALIVVPQAGCIGSPQFSNFTAIPSNISPGQQSVLTWGSVSNADQISLHTPFGSSGVSAPNQQVVFPTFTSSYILTAFCKSNRVDAAVTINVTNLPPPTQTPQYNFINPQPAQYAGVGAINVPVQYYYSNQNAPGQIQITAYNGSGYQVGYSQVGAIPFATRTDNVTVSIPSGYRDAVNIRGCLVDSFGNNLSCNAGLGIR